MLSLPPGVRLFVALDRIDMRKGFDALAAIVQHQLGLDPLRGHIVLFVNKRGNLMKLLFFDRTGWAGSCSEEPSTGRSSCSGTTSAPSTGSRRRRRAATRWTS